MPLLWKNTFLRTSMSCLLIACSLTWCRWRGQKQGCTVRYVAHAMKKKINEWNYCCICVIQLCNAYLLYNKKSPATSVHPAPFPIIAREQQPYWCREVAPSNPCKWIKAGGLSTIKFIITLSIFNWFSSSWVCHTCKTYIYDTGYLVKSQIQVFMPKCFFFSR